MWFRSPVRRSSLSIHRGNSRTRSRTERTRQALRLETLEDRQLLSGAMQFDFGPASGYAVAPGYKSVQTAAFSSTTGYGWQTASSVYTGGNWWPNPNPVIDDFDYTVNNTFTVNLPNGTYTVVPTLGSFATAQSQVAVSLNGQQVASNLATAPEQFISPAYQVTVSTGQLAVHFQNMSGKYCWLDALSILPGQVQPPTESPGRPSRPLRAHPSRFSQATASGTGTLGYNWTLATRRQRRRPRRNLTRRMYTRPPATIRRCFK